MLYKECIISDIDNIRQYVCESIKETKQTVFQISLPLNIIKKLQEDLKITNDVVNASIFIIKNHKGLSEGRLQKDKFKLLHIDCIDDNICEVSLYIPITNYNENYAMWAIGDYELQRKININKLGQEIIRYIPIWKNNNYSIVTKKVSEPMLINTKQPHIFYNMDKNPRISLSIRFGGNPTFNDFL